MANYFSGEEIKVGDFITTDNGHDKNKVIKLIDNTYLMQSYGLDCFGAVSYTHLTLPTTSRV